MVFECPYDAVLNGLYKFHDNQYSKENPNDIIESFYKLVDSIVQNKEPLFCIGFNFTWKVILNRIDFHNRVFFNYAYFREETIFSIDFLDDINFFSTVFIKETTFNSINFHALAYFSDAIFIEETTFNKVTFKKLANFPNVKFREDVTINFANFEELANFHIVTF